MPYYNRDPKRDHDFDNHPYCSGVGVPSRSESHRKVQDFKADMLIKCSGVKVVKGTRFIERL